MQPSIVSGLNSAASKHNSFTNNMFNLLVKSVVLVVLLSSAPILGKKTTKRGVPDYGLSSYGDSFGSMPQDSSFSFSSSLSPQPLPVYVKSLPLYTPTFTIQKQYVPAPVSPADIAAAVAAAKEASNQVQYAQQRVQNAKDAVIEQQRIAQAKESQAALAQQRSEAAAAVQRQAASAAANAVINAQQKLAQAKSEVSQLQKIASGKEAIAAALISKSAHAAAAEVQRSEDTAAKLAALQRSGAAAAIQQVSAAKDATLAATAAAVSAANIIHPPPSAPAHPPIPKYGPWQ